MPRILAVDWDDREVRFVLASATGGKLKVRAAASVPLTGDEESEGGEPDVGRSIKAALASRKPGASTTLVGVGRGSVELLQLTLPPATDAELPDLVANQAIQESQLVTEQSVIDYFALGDDPKEPREVTAAAMSAEEFRRIRAVCSEAGLKPQRMLLRTFAGTALFSRLAPGAERVCLLVNRVGSEVDLTVLLEGKPVVTRTVRLPETPDEEKTDARLLAEIHRTLIVALQGQPDEASIDRVYLLGRPAEYERLMERLREELAVPATVFDPFSALEVPDEVVPEESGRFVPLLGMVVCEAWGRRHAVDFLHPKQSPKPLDRRRVLALAAGAVALILAIAGYWLWAEVSALDRQIDEAKDRYETVSQTLDKVEEQQKAVKSIRQWQAGEIVWLDELRDLSARFPSGRDAMVLRMSMSAGQRGGGAIRMNGLVRHSSIVYNLEENLRDKYHQVHSTHVGKRDEEENYTWLFESSIDVARRPASSYAAAATSEKAPAGRAAAETGPRVAASSSTKTPKP